MVGIVGGEGTVVSLGRVLVAKPGSVYIIPPGISFREKNNSGESWHFACLKVKLARHVMEWEMPNNAPTFLDRDFAIVARLAEIIKALHYRGPGFELKAIGGALMLFGHLKERGGQKTSPDDSSDMTAKAIEVIRKNLKTPISLSCLAKICNVSESCLSHQFKKEMGLSPMQYTRRERVKAAKELILTGTDVYEASERLGFKTQFHLSKIFTAVEGKPPIFFRKLARYKQSL